MNERAYALLGVAGPLGAYIFIGISIASAPWFSWWDNALSDLGYALRKESAPPYDFGLAAAGFLITVYASTAFRKHARYTSACLAASAFLLQLVAVFDDVYGALHQTVSLLFFISLGVTSIAYAIERRSLAAAAALMIGLSSWTLYWAGLYRAGIAVPEIVSATAVVSWIVLSALRILLQRS